MEVGVVRPMPGHFTTHYSLDKRLSKPQRPGHGAKETISALGHSLVITLIYLQSCIDKNIQK
jgi:hypothetical protein